MDQQVAANDDDDVVDDEEDLLGLVVPKPWGRVMQQLSLCPINDKCERLNLTQKTRLEDLSLASSQTSTRTLSLSLSLSHTHTHTRTFTFSHFLIPLSRVSRQDLSDTPAHTFAVT